MALVQRAAKAQKTGHLSLKPWKWPNWPSGLVFSTLLSCKFCSTNCGVPVAYVCAIAKRTLASRSMLSTSCWCKRCRQSCALLRIQLRRGANRNCELRSWMPRKMEASCSTDFLLIDKESAYKKYVLSFILLFLAPMCGLLHQVFAFCLWYMSCWDPYKPLGLRWGMGVKLQYVLSRYFCRVECSEVIHLSISNKYAAQ